jgi:SAM-dependent methyltransferase
MVIELEGQIPSMQRPDHDGSAAAPEDPLSADLALNPMAFVGTAPYYALGRPPYSAALRRTLQSELDLDGSGQLLDVGCGPGVLVLELANLFATVVALDPEPGMLAEGQRQADLADLRDVRWIRGVAEDLGSLAVGPCRLVTFGQSFHRVNRRVVADLVYDALEPGGAVAMVTHAYEGRPRPPELEYPMIPYDAAQELIIRFLGESTRTYLETWARKPVERFEDVLAKTRFGRPRVVYAPGRPDIVRDIDSVVAGYFSMSYAAPPLFGERRDEFESALRALLLAHSPQGLFWDWPGDTEIVLASKH